MPFLCWITPLAGELGNFWRIGNVNAPTIGGVTPAVKRAFEAAVDNLPAREVRTQVRTLGVHHHDLTRSRTEGHQIAIVDPLRNGTCTQLIRHAEEIPGGRESREALGRRGGRLLDLRWWSHDRRVSRRVSGMRRGNRIWRRIGGGARRCAGDKHQSVLLWASSSVVANRFSSSPRYVNSAPARLRSSQTGRMYWSLPHTG